jgi:hypothetical protein
MAPRYLGIMQVIVAAMNPGTSDPTSVNPVALPAPDSVTSPPGRRPRKGVLLAIAAIVVAAVAVAALFGTAILPHPGSTTSGTSGEALSYSAARSLSSAAASGVLGGPWTLFDAMAYDVNTSAPFGLAFNLWVSGPPMVRYLTSARPPVPALRDPLSSGLSPWWLFEYDNGTTTTRNLTVVLGIVVVNGTASPLAIFSTLLDVGVPSSIPSTGLVDTPVAMSAAIASNTSFVGAHPGLNATLILSPGGPPPAKQWWWLIDFTTCLPFFQLFGANGTTYPGLHLGAQVNATSGIDPFTGILPDTVTCSSTGYF